MRGKELILEMKKNGNIKIKIFVLVMMGWMAIAWTFLLSGRGVWEDYFVKGSRFSDFYSPMAKNISNTYLPPFFSNYPPLANLIFVVLRKITRVEVDGEFVIPNQQVYACFGVFLILCVLQIFWMTTKWLSKKDESIINYLLMFLLLISGPFLFLYDRGNILVGVIGLVGYFLFYYDSEDRWKRNIAKICIAVAIAIKIYPVIYLLVYIKNRQWKETRDTVLITTIFYIVPFGIYGYDTIKLFIDNLFYRDGTVNNVLNHTISLKGTIKLADGIVWQHIDEIPNTVLWVAGCALLYVFFTNGRKWIQMMAVSMLLIWMFNGSYLYNVCFLIYPLLEFLSDQTKRKTDVLYIVLFNIIFSINFWHSISGLNRILEVHLLGNVAWNIVITQVGLLLMVIALFIDTVVERRRETQTNVI